MIPNDAEPRLKTVSIGLEKLVVKKPYSVAGRQRRPYTLDPYTLDNDK
jgi:hypothetical protein